MATNVIPVKPIELSKPSIETDILQNPEKYGLVTIKDLLTPIAGEPDCSSRGRKRNPAVTMIYNHLILNRDQWFHVNIPFTSAKQLSTFRVSLYGRAKKDHVKVTSRSRFNDSNKTFDVWVKLSNNNK